MINLGLVVFLCEEILDHIVVGFIVIFVPIR